MKLLLFTDIHSNKSHLETVKKKALHADALICLGDLTMFQAYMKLFLRELNGIGKPVLMLPGNHESEEALKKACEDLKNITFIHKQHHKIGDPKKHLPVLEQVAAKKTDNCFVSRGAQRFCPRGQLL